STSRLTISCRSAAGICSGGKWRTTGDLAGRPLRSGRPRACAQEDCCVARIQCAASTITRRNKNRVFLPTLRKQRGMEKRIRREQSDTADLLRRGIWWHPALVARWEVDCL